MLADEQLGLLPERLPQAVVEVGEDVDVGLETVEVPEVQPLAGEVPHECPRPSIGEHAPHLRLQHLRLAEPLRRRQLEQLVVRDAAPEEERQARRQGEVVDAVQRVRRRAGWIALDSEQELRADEQPFDCPLNAGIESLRATGLVKRQQPGDVVVRRGTTVGAAGEAGEDASRARGFIRGTRRFTREDPFATRRLARTGRRVGTADRQGAQVRLHPCVAAGASVGTEERQPRRLGRRRGLPQECHRHRAWARSDRHAHVPIRVQPAAGSGRRATAAPSRRRPKTFEREEADALAVDADLEVMGLVKSGDVDLFAAAGAAP